MKIWKNERIREVVIKDLTLDSLMKLPDVINTVREQSSEWKGIVFKITNKAIVILSQFAPSIRCKPYEYECREYVPNRKFDGYPFSCDKALEDNCISHLTQSQMVNRVLKVRQFITNLPSILRILFENNFKPASIVVGYLIATHTNMLVDSTTFCAVNHVYERLWPDAAFEEDLNSLGSEHPLIQRITQLFYLLFAQQDEIGLLRIVSGNFMSIFTLLSSGLKLQHNISSYYPRRCRICMPPTPH